VNQKELTRFWAKVRKEDGCWRWTGSLKPDGYGRFSYNGTMILAHQAMWIITNGELPEETRIVLRCGNRWCVNPDHLATADDQEFSLARFWGKVDVGVENACWLWQGARGKRGYGNVKWRGKYWYAHRLSYFLEYGPIPEGKVVAHVCDTPLCVNPQHLFLGTHSENMNDMARKHRGKWDTHPELTKITRADAYAMREAYTAGLASQKELQKQYGLSQSHTSAILNGIRWRG
jgi:hypothetical protein